MRAEQEKPCEETPLGSHEKCNTQPERTWVHDPGESNRKKTRRGVTEERNKGRRAARQITLWGIPGNFRSHAHTLQHSLARRKVLALECQHQSGW